MLPAVRWTTPSRLRTVLRLSARSTCSLSCYYEGALRKASQEKRNQVAIKTVGDLTVLCYAGEAFSAPVVSSGYRALKKHPRASNKNLHPAMSEETDNPETVPDEQLEEVAGGTMDNFVLTKNCTAILSTISL
jgi:hypothetical protein